MAAYPSVGMLTTVTPETVMRHDVSESGAVRGVDLSEEMAYAIAVSHPLLNAADRDTVLAFYTANRNSLVTLTAGDGRTYDVLFTTEPTVEVINPTRFTLTSNLFGNVQ